LVIYRGSIFVPGSAIKKMKAAVCKILALLCIVLVCSATAGNKRQPTATPAAYRPVDKDPAALSDDNNYGCGFHIVFNSTLY